MLPQAVGGLLTFELDLLCLERTALECVSGGGTIDRLL